MNPSQPAISPPLAYAAEIAFDINLMRQECCEGAQWIASHRPVDEATLEEYACLDEALAAADLALKTALTQIHAARARRHASGA